MAVYDVVTLGTSLTAGTGTGFNGTNVLNGGGWQPYLENALRPGKKSEIRVLNFGFAGQTSTAGLNAAPIIAGLRPKFVTIEFSVNDASTAAGITTAMSGDRAIQMANTIKAASPETKFALMTMNPVGGSFLTSRPNWADYYQAYRNVAAANPQLFYLIDNLPKWDGWTTTMMPDSLHPQLPYVVEKLIPDMVAVIAPLIE